MDKKQTSKQNMDMPGGTNPVDSWSDPSWNEDEFESAAKRRALRRKRDRRLKRIFITVILLILLALACAVYAFVLVPRDSDLPWPAFWGNRPSVSVGSLQAEKETGTNPLLQAIENQIVSSQETEPAQPVVILDPQIQQAAAQAETETETESEPVLPPSQAHPEMLEEAALLAAGYDYDGAIARLQSISGFDTDADIQQLIQGYQAQKDACVSVDIDTVPHIFYHSLLNDTSRAFNTEVLGQGAVDGFNAWMTTLDEFDQITQRLYDAGYVYVRLRDLVIQTTDAEGNVHFAPNTELKLPEGKKALVLSVDDCSYYHSYEAAGFPDKLVLDENGNVKCQYTDAAGNTTIGDFDVAPRLNTFLEQHPDGAYHGARGIMAMTGYNGVFGYRTDIDYLLQENLMEDQRDWLNAHPDYNYDKDVEDATNIANALKEEGWEFASHTWGHLSVTGKSAEELKIDNEKWVATVQPIVGEVDTIVFAHGNDIGSWEGYSADNEQYAYYNSVGYHFYCNVDGSVPYWVQITDSYVRQGRINADGYRLYLAQNGEDSSLSQLIDLGGVFNENRPTPVVANGES